MADSMRLRMRRHLKGIATRVMPPAVSIAARCGLDLRRRLVSTRRVTHIVPGATYRTRIPATVVQLQPPQFQVPGVTQGRYLRGIQRWGLHYQTYDAGLLTLPDARFELPQCALGVKGRFIEEIYPFAEFPPPLGVHRYAMLFRRSAMEVEPGTFLPMLGYKNYFHWLTEIMPRLQLLADTPWAERPIYVNAALPGFAKQMLGRLDLPFRHLSDGFYQAGTLCVPTRLSQIEMNAPAALQWLRRTFLPADAPGTRRRRLFISRKDAPSRALPMEDAIVSRLSSLGFETVIASKLSFAEQVALFSEAECVTGAHGAGFSNIVWMPPGGALVEITTDAHAGLCFWRMCNQLGLKHGFIEAKGPALEFDVDAYLKLIEAALAGLPGR